MITTGQSDQIDNRPDPSMNLFMPTFEQGAVGIAHVAPDGNWIRVNQRLCDILGYSVDELMGRTFQEVTYAEDLSPDLDYVQQMLAGKIATYSMHKRYLHKDGRVVWTKLTVSLVRDEAGQPDYFVSVIEDLTTLHQIEQELRQSKDRYQQIVNLAQKGIWLMGEDLKTTYANPALADLLGYSAEELVGVPLSAFMVEENRKIFLLVEQSPAAVVERHDVCFQCKDGTFVWGIVKIHPLYEDGRHVGALGMVNDITERKRYELEMERKNRDLETLLYITSHDLREPLRAIQNFSQLVQSRYQQEVDEKGQDFLMRIVRASKRMDTLIENILELSRAQRHVKPKEWVAGEELVQQALLNLEHQISTTNATITVEAPLPKFFVDRIWTVQAIYNLIGNAIKFAGTEPPQIEIAPYLAETQPTAKEGLVIRDRGIGINPDHAERIFGLFQRAVGREIDGTGAGLAIVREVAERQDGSVWAQPRVGGGAEFFITFGIGPELTKAQGVPHVESHPDPIS